MAKKPNSLTIKDVLSSIYERQGSVHMLFIFMNGRCRNLEERKNEIDAMRKGISFQGLFNVIGYAFNKGILVVEIEENGVSRRS